LLAGVRTEGGNSGDAATFIHADVSVESDVKAMNDHAVDRFDRLDCLVNNAGRSSQYAAIADVDLKQFDAVIAGPARRPCRNEICSARDGRTRNEQHYQRCQCKWIPRRTGRTLLFSREGRFDSLDALRSHGVG